MANVNSITSTASSASSLYGNRNVLSGLASGLDTESMIENSITGYRTKISTLEQQQTQLQWKQDAYRDIIDKAAAFNTKYTSFSSSTNLMSSGFFTSASTTTPVGAHADMVAATGKSTSTVQLNSVTQLATAARYSVSANSLSNAGAILNSTTEPIGVGDTQVSSITGRMTIAVGGRRISLDFAESETYENNEEFVNAINAKLAEIDTTKSGKTVKADTVLEAKLNGNTLSFEVKDGSGDMAYLYTVSNGMKDVGLTANWDPKTADREYDLSGYFVKNQSMGEYLNNKTMTVTLNGTAKTFSLGEKDDDGGIADVGSLDDLIDRLNRKLDAAFGEGQVTASVGENGGIAFTSAKANSSLFVESTAGDRLGLANGVGNYVNTGTALKDALDSGYDWSALTAGVDKDGNVMTDKDGNTLYEMKINGESVGYFNENSSIQDIIRGVNASKAGVTMSYSKITNEFVFETKDTGSGQRITFDKFASDLFGSIDGAPAADPTDTRVITNLPQKLQEIITGGDTLRLQMGPDPDAVLEVNADTTMEELGHAVESVFQSYESQVDVRLAYNETTGRINISRTPGSTTRLSDYINLQVQNNDASLEDDDRVLNLIYDLFDKVNHDGVTGGGSSQSNTVSRAGTFTAGTDAVLNVTVNGRTMDLERASNTVDLDGLNVTLKGAFETSAGESPITFQTSASSDKVVDAVRTFVQEYNDLVNSVRTAYNTQPNRKSDGSSYMPLTDSDRQSMSESAIKDYEETAKTGILFGDSDLSAFYSQLVARITPGGDLRKAMEAIGLTTSYSQGVTTLSLDESKLRSAMEADVDSVKNVFADSTYGANDGLMSQMKSTLETYASTSIATPGALVRKAGTKLSALSLTDNVVQKQINSLQSKIEEWQTKMSSKVDYYTRQFSMLEQLMNRMNNQSSMLSGLMGGSGY